MILDAVHVAAEEMRDEQLFVIKLGFISIASLMNGSLFQTWDNYNYELAFLLSVIYLSGFYYFITTGLKSFNTFSFDFEVSSKEHDKGKLTVFRSDT